MTLPRLHTVTEVAEALQQTEHYVAQQARKGRWPHKRGARGAVLFADEDVAKVIELLHRDAASDEPATFLTARSQRSLARRRTP